MTREDEINELIKDKGIDTNKISDGYHTFGELYSHRIELWIALCKMSVQTEQRRLVWRSTKHSDGTEIDGWFLLGMSSTNGLQMTYHLPIGVWNKCYFATQMDTAPTWDGHTSNDVIDRLQML